MKILHVPYTYYPDAVGGTEIYVEGLAHAQQAAGTEAMIAAPGDRADSYEIRGLQIRRFSVLQQVLDVREMYGEGDVTAADAFADILEVERPDIVHIHAFTRGVSLRLVRAAKRAGTIVVFSYHTPTVSCQRGTLLKWGKEVCDGYLDVKTCTECTLHGRGISRMFSAIMCSMSDSIGGVAASAGVSGSFWTALRMKELVELRHTAFHSLMDEVDHVIALAHWVKELLQCNRVPPQKITVSRQGLAESACCAAHWTGSRRRDPGEPIRMAFFGRLDPTKGVHVLIRALQMLSNTVIELDVFGIAQGEGGAAYLRQLQAVAAGDTRISFYDPLPAQAVVNQLCEYDVLAAPSQWLETGPLVILEAFAAGVPVLGSDIAGIRETVTDGVDGLLVRPFDSAAAWAEKIRNVVENQALLPRLRNGIRSPRRISTCAAEMAAVYRSLIKANACA